MNNTELMKKILFLIITALPFYLQASERAELDCMVKPEMYVELSSPVDGVLESLIVDKGARIKKDKPWHKWKHQ